MKLYILIGAIGLSFLLFGCKSHNETHEHDEYNEMENNPNQVSFCSNKAKELGFQTQKIEPTLFHQVIKTSGKIVAAQGKETTVASTMTGIVNLSNNIIEGVEVNQGTSLAIISLKNTTEGEPYEKAKIAYEAAKAEFERAKPLADKKIISEKEFLQIQLSFNEAQLAYNAIKRNNSPKGQNIPSPMKGFLKTIWVTEGDYVEIGQPIATITQTKHLFLRAEVAERYYDQLPYITSANFKTPYNKECYSLDELNGKLVSTGKSSNEESNFIPVTFAFENKGNIIPGSYMEIFLLSQPISDQWVVPISALIEEQGLFFVYTQIDEENYLKKEVQLGMNNGQSVQILSGLSSNDLAVIKGAQQLKLASASSSIPAHTHDH